MTNSLAGWITCITVVLGSAGCTQQPEPLTQSVAGAPTRQGAASDPAKPDSFHALSQRSGGSFGNLFVNAAGAQEPTQVIDAADATQVQLTDAPTTAEADATRRLPSAPVMTGNPTGAAVADRLTKRDPRHDAIQAEVANELISRQLKKLGKLVSDAPESSGRTHQIAAEDIHFAEDAVEVSSLRPDDLQKIYEGSIDVFRASGSTQDAKSQGKAALAEALNSLASALGDGSIFVKFKVTQVRIFDDRIESESIYLAKSLGSESLGSGAVQQNAIWTCTWSPGSDEALPKLRSVSVRNFEEVVRTTGNGGPLMTDVTEAVLGQEESYRQQLMHGIPYWMSRLQGSLGSDVVGHQGMAVGDINGDGLDDLYICQVGGLPNRLFVQNPDGTASDVTADAGLDLLDLSRNALILDLDNDGDQDTAVLTKGALALFKNAGDGKFTLAQQIADLGNAFSLTSADYDLDGKLDIFVCGYSYPTGKAQVPLPYHDANNGFRNRLLRNEGGWSFTDVTEAVGLDKNNRRYSFSAAWEDFDNDGDSDLYVANDYGRNNLYRNDSGQFVDIAADAGVEDISAGMAVTWGDYNRDGLMDLYVSNMFSSAGNRVTYQRKFREDFSEEVRTQYQRHARGNSLFKNLGNETFQDVSVASGTTMGRWAWGSRFVDLNNDGWEDLVVANGNLTGENTGDL